MTESHEDYRKRIRGLVEKHPGKCPFCGFLKYSEGAVHPFAGVHGQTRTQTDWCNGFRRIPSKEKQQTF